MAGQECHMRRLPVELLEAISHQVQPDDLLSLRLSCRRLAEVVFNDFADNFIKDLSCFFPDRARVQRLQNITSQPHLLNKIKAVTLTLDVFEYGDDNLQFVVPAHDRGDMRPAYIKSHRELMELHHCSRCRDLGTLTHCLQNLDPLQTELTLDLAHPIPYPDGLVWGKISHQIFTAIGKANYPIHHLYHLSQRDLQQALLHDPQYWMYCTPCHALPAPSVETEMDFANSTLTSGHGGISSVLVDNTVDAEAFDCVIWYAPRPHKMIRFIDNILAEHRSHCLKRLTLIRLELPGFENLLPLLSRNSTTLSAITLNDFAVATDEPGEWKQLLEFLNTMPKLEHLQLAQLCWKSQHNPPLLIITRDTHLAVACNETGHSSVMAALGAIIAKGIAVKFRSQGLVPLW